MKFQDDISVPHTHTHTHGQAETNMSPTFSKLGGINIKISYLKIEMLRTVQIRNRWHNRVNVLTIIFDSMSYIARTPINGIPPQMRYITALRTCRDC